MTMRLCAFFARDIELLSSFVIKNTQEALLAGLEKQWGCLALDLETAGYYRQKGIPFRMPFHIVSDQETDAIETRTCEIFNKLCRMPFPKGMWAANWIEQDYASLGISLAGALYAEALGKWFLEQKVEELFFVQGDPLRAFSLGYPHSDITSSVWRAMLPDTSRPIFLEQTVAEPEFPPSDYSLLKNRVCFFMHEFEHFRMAPFVNHTAAKKDVAVISNHVFTGNAMPCKNRPFPTLFQLPCEPAPVPEDVADAFVSLWNSLLPPGLDWFARHLLTQRWSGLEATYRHWLDIMRQYPPALCVVSNNFLPHCDIPILAARQCGIPVVSMPHAAVNEQLPGLRGPLESDAMIFTMPLMAEIQKECTPHIPSYSVRQVRLEQEYDITAQDTTPKKSNHVLFINTVLGTPHLLAYSSLPNKLIEQLTEFQQLFLERREHVSLSYKQHPGKPEFPLLQMAGIPQEQWLAFGANLQSALRGASVVVSYNYRGAPIVFAMKCGIPVITFDTNPPVQTDKRFWTRSWYQKKLRGDVEVTTAAEAWAAIDRLHTDNAWRQELLKRQKELVLQSFGLGKTDWFSLMEELTGNRKG